MFIELFQTIYNHIGEFLLSLGLSIPVIYTALRGVKGLIYVIFYKKKDALKKQANQEAIANLTASKVAEILAPEILDIKTSLNELKEHLGVVDKKVSENKNEELEAMAIEVKSYQTVMLSQDPELQLQYEQIKSRLINLSKQVKPIIEDVATTTSIVANNATEGIVSNEENIIKATEDVAKTVKAVKNTARKIKKKATQVVYE